MMAQLTYEAALIEDDGQITASFPMPMNPRFIGLSLDDERGECSLFGGDDPREIADGSGCQRMYARVGSSVRVRDADGVIRSASVMFVRMW